jgi:hypothetical protein
VHNILRAHFGMYLNISSSSQGMRLHRYYWSIRRKLLKNSQYPASKLTEMCYIMHHSDIRNCVMVYMTVLIPESCCMPWSRHPRNKALRVAFMVRICNQRDLLLPDRARNCNSFSSSIQASLMLSSSSSIGKSSSRIDLSTFKASSYLQA